MLVANFVRDWALGRGMAQPHPISMTELVSLYGGPGRGGGTRGAAKALGLPMGTAKGLTEKQRKTEIASSERLIQRRMQYEAGAGTTKQARPGRKGGGKEITRQDLARAIRAATPEGAALKDGIAFDFVTARMGKSNRWEPGRTVGTPPGVHIPGAALKDFIKAVRRDDWDEAARELEEQWADAYGAPMLLWDDEWGTREGVKVHIPVVDDLSMEIGAAGTA